MATYYVKRQEVIAANPDDILPRFQYTVTCVNVADSSDVQVISFLSDDENPLSAQDTCNTVKDLLADGELDADCSLLP